MNENNHCCWINQDEQVLSFHPIVGFLMKEFTTHEELIAYVFEATSSEHYRVQQSAKEREA